jgi:hypothetical protein
MAAHAYSLLDSSISGIALEQRNVPVRTPAQVATVAGESLQRLALSDYPYLVEMLTQHALQPGYDYAEEFVFGLDPILDGSEQLRYSTENLHARNLQRRGARIRFLSRLSS